MVWIVGALEFPGVCGRGRLKNSPISLTTLHLGRSPFFRINAVNPKNIPLNPLLPGLKIFVAGLIKAYAIHPKGRSAFPNPLLRKKT
jgi:hypothetical protein